MRPEQEILQDIVNCFAKVGEHQFKVRSSVAHIEGLYKKIDELNLEYSEVKAQTNKDTDKKD